MTRVEELTQQVSALSPEELTAFQTWYLEFQNEMWDRQIAADDAAGRLDHLIAEAMEDYAQGKVLPL